MASRPKSNDRPDAPFGPPDCPWEPMSSSSSIPESIFDCGGKLNGEKVYVGRVYDDEDKSYLIGTAIPSKGVCTYITKDLKVKTSDTYEILTISCGEPLVFKPKDWECNLLFVSGGDEDRCLYCSRVVENENTYFGWADNSTEAAYIPRDQESKVLQGYDILIHQYLDRLCVCPMPPQPPPF